MTLLNITLLQMDQAAGLFSDVAQQGIVFGLLVAIILVLAVLIAKLYKESKAKSKAHGEAMALKDKKIEELSEARRQDSIDTINFVRDLQKDMQNLTDAINRTL